MRTVALYNIFGVSKAKTAKAVLLHETTTDRMAWIPLSVASVKFIGTDYKVKVTVPDWFFNKIAWKTAASFAPKAKPDNPYIGADVGNMMEERMVLTEIYDSLDETNSDHAAELAGIAKRLRMIEEAVALAQHA